MFGCNGGCASRIPVRDEPSPSKPRSGFRGATKRSRQATRSSTVAAAETARRATAPTRSCKGTTKATTGGATAGICPTASTATAGLCTTATSVCATTTTTAAAGTSSCSIFRCSSCWLGCVTRPHEWNDLLCQPNHRRKFLGETSRSCASSSSSTRSSSCTYSPTKSRTAYGGCFYPFPHKYHPEEADSCIQVWGRFCVVGF
mmetsp:Transcript_19595/g.53979  ORF Transcript_19595/g.53979 Transcript_19595/m.53979 type:complete len:202 (+) Transcript_19595:2380-2985(+)